MDGDVDAQEDKYPDQTNIRATPMSGSHTPATSRRRDDETATSFSRRSANSQSQRALRIVRTVIQDGERVEQEYFETDPAVIKQYMKIKELEESQNIRLVNLFRTVGRCLPVFSLNDIAPTGDAEFDARQRRRQDIHPSTVQKFLAPANCGADLKKSLPNSRRTQLAESNAPKTKPPSLPPLRAVPPCLPTATEGEVVAGTHRQRNESVPIVAKWATLKPTKSQSSAITAISPLIARLDRCSRMRRVLAIQ
jgi:hypothetical protein